MKEFIAQTTVNNEILFLLLMGDYVKILTLVSNFNKLCAQSMYKFTVFLIFCMSIRYKICAQWKQKERFL